MRSKVVTDSLLQIALLLSLLRSNVDDYLHLFAGFSQDNEISDVILGDASAIVQTNNYHNQWDRSLDGFSHPKNIDRLFADHHIQDYYRQSIQPAEIATYLLPVIQQTSSQPAPEENTDSSQASNSNNNNNNESYIGDAIALQWQADLNSEDSRSESSDVASTSSQSHDDLDLTPEVRNIHQFSKRSSYPRNPPPLSLSFS